MVSFYSFTGSITASFAGLSTASGSIRATGFSIGIRSTGAAGLAASTGFTLASTYSSKTTGYIGLISTGLISSIAMGFFSSIATGFFSYLTTAFAGLGLIVVLTTYLRLIAFALGLSGTTAFFFAANTGALFAKTFGFSFSSSTLVATNGLISSLFWTTMVGRVSPGVSIVNKDREALGGAVVSAIDAIGG